jgi:hypothetical protein
MVLNNNPLVYVRASFVFATSIFVGGNLVEFHIETVYKKLHDSYVFDMKVINT